MQGLEGGEGGSTAKAVLGEEFDGRQRCTRQHLSCELCFSCLCCCNLFNGQVVLRGGFFLSQLKRRRHLDSRRQMKANLRSPVCSSRYVVRGAKLWPNFPVNLQAQMGMVDRGADLSWLSQYPGEKEVLFAPLTGMEVIGEPRVENGTGAWVLVVCGAFHHLVVVLLTPAMYC